MNRLVICILVLFLMFDLADDGCLGKAKLNLPNPTVKTSLTSSYHDSHQTDFHHNLASAPWKWPI